MDELPDMIEAGGRSLLGLLALGCILVVVLTLGCLVLTDLDGRTALGAALLVLVVFVAGGVLSVHGWLTRPGHRAGAAVSKGELPSRDLFPEEERGL
jgi:apolipoprotein N-acyltransferase